jgi:hypothetical protein
MFQIQETARIIALVSELTTLRATKILITVEMTLKMFLVDIPVRFAVSPIGAVIPSALREKWSW